MSSFLSPAGGNGASCFLTPSRIVTLNTTRQVLQSALSLADSRVIKLVLGHPLSTCPAGSALVWALGRHKGVRRLLGLQGLPTASARVLGWLLLHLRQVQAGELPEPWTGSCMAEWGQSPGPARGAYPRCLFLPSGVVPSPPIQAGDALVQFVSLWSSSGEFAEFRPFWGEMQPLALTHQGLDFGLEWSGVKS